MSLLPFFFLMIRRPPSSTLFPYTSSSDLPPVHRGSRHVRRETRPAGDVRDRRHHRQAVFHGDRKSTRLNSSHANISYAVFCLKKKMFRSIVAGALGVRGVFRAHYDVARAL